jgi:uncharacterized membrane protein YjfL (UPF0719 family)
MLAAIVYSLLGIVVLIVTFIAVDKLTPRNLWKEITEKGNIALAILAGSFMIALGMIISSAIHG